MPAGTLVMTLRQYAEFTGEMEIISLLDESTLDSIHE